MKGDGCEGDGAQLGPNKIDFSVHSVSMVVRLCETNQYIPTLSTLFLGACFNIPVFSLSRGVQAVLV